MKKNILITGAGGFIGKNLREYFSKLYRIFGPTHKELDLLETERVEDYIVNHKINFIVHAANVGGERNTPTLKDSLFINLKMFFNLVRNQSTVEKSSTLEVGQSLISQFQLETLRKRILTEEFLVMTTVSINISVQNM